MRDLLTIAAGIVILALSAALAVPYFVDWGAQRLEVEAQLSRALGARVSVAGAIDMRLLPTPSLTLERVAVEDGGPVSGSAQSAHFEIAVAPLLRGQIEVLEARLERPRVEIALDGLPMGGASRARDLKFERIVLRNGAVGLNLGGRRVMLDKLDLDARAASLDGPFKGDGAVNRDGVRTPFRFSTAEREGERLRFKLVVDSAAGWPRAEFDGAFVAGGRLEGRAVVAGKLGATPWRIAGDMASDAQGARATQIEARLGEEETLASASGEGELAFGETPRAHLRLSARQLDLDRLRSAETGDGAGVDAALASLSRAGALAIDLQADVATLAGDTISGLVGKLTAAAGAPARLDLSAALPGRTRGALSFDPAATPIAGRVELHSEDWPRFARWAGQVAPAASGALRSLTARDAGLSGDFTARPGGFDLAGLTLTLGKTRYSGNVGFRSAAPGRRANVEADLAASALDLDALPDFSAFEAGDVDLAIRLDARAVRVARAGQAPVSAGRIVLAMARDAGGLRLERLKVDDVAGAQIEARANFGRGGGRVEFSSAAQDFRAPADILRRLAPGAVSAALAARAGALSPMRLAGSAEFLRIGEALAPTAFTVDGEAGGARLSGRMVPAADGKTQSQLTIESADGAVLLAQLGAPVFDLAGVGPGRISVEASGRAGEPANARIAARFGPSVVDFDGTLDLDLLQPRAEGRLAMRSPDIAPLARGLELAFPELTASLPLEATARASYAEGRLRLEAIAASLAGTRVEGAATRGADGAIDGALRLERLSLPWLASVVLGPAQPARAKAVWSDLRFAPDAAAPPPTRLNLEARTLDIAAGLIGVNGRMKLDLAPGRLALNEAAAEVAGARVEGRLSLRRDGAEASIAGQARIANLALDLPSLKTRLGFSLDFAGAGASAAALVGSLAGGGAGEATELRLPRSDPSAALRVVEAAETEKIAIDEASVARALERELDRAEARLPATRLDVALLGGVLKLTAPGVETGLDLRTLSLDQRNRLAAPTAPKGWKGAPPEADVRFTGAISAPQRSVDGSALTQALAARAIAREQARIEAFEFDIRERAFFYRRLKSERAREAARLKAEDDKRRAEEEARRKAEEEARKAAGEANAPLNILPPAAVRPAPVDGRQPVSPLPKELFEEPPPLR